jgi:hypothetical protein
MQWFSRNSPEVQVSIRQRATQIYENSGRRENRDLQNWYQAEAEILREYGAESARPAVIVNVQGVVYTGEYESASSDGYRPGEWKPGDPVPIRVEGGQLYLRRPNGRELKTTIIKRIG